MNEINPLHISLLPSAESNGRYTNKRGRPKAEKAIKCSPQPMSMVVAQMLLRKKSEEQNVHQDTPETLFMCMSNDDKHDVVDEAKDINKINTNSIKNPEINDSTTQKQYSCDYPSCSYSCKLSTNLTKHKRIHTGEKPYLCDRCSFRSNFINSLKTHKRIHTSERPYQCKHCSYKCNSSSNLKKHCHQRHPVKP